MRKIFLLLGGNKLNYGIFLKFKEFGYQVYVVDWNENPSIKGDKHYKIDVKKSDDIISALEKDGEWKYVVFAYSSIDVAVKSVACINRKIGLKTISDEGICFASSKSLMTSKWGEMGLLNRFSKGYQDYSEEIDKLNQIKNIIIKPDNSASSRGITIVLKNSSKEKVIEAFEKAYKEATNGIVVVEEYIEGTEYTVEMLGDNYGNVCVYAISVKAHTCNTQNNKIAVKLLYNSIDEEMQNEIAEYGIKCFKALGFSSSLGHLEVLVTPDKRISPVEIGARSSGFIASDLVDIVSGSNYLFDLIDVQNGKKIENGLHHQTDKAAMYFFYDFPNHSKVLHPFSILDFCNPLITSRYFDRSNIIQNKEYSNITNDNERIGYEILEGPRELLTLDYIVNAEKKMISSMLEE